MQAEFPIGDMAKMHNISRQTLIYYDRIDLFKPHRVDTNGYRYYHANQIPLLREICFLKELGIKLDIIKRHIGERDVESAISLLERHKAYIDNEIRQLLVTRNFIDTRLNLYQKAYQFQDEIDLPPVIKEFPERKVVFLPYEDEVNKKQLHLVMMKAWKLLIEANILPSAGFGSILKASNVNMEDIRSSDVLKDAGAYVTLPIDNMDIPHTRVLPAGLYLSKYKYAMPYETEHLFKLLEWMKTHDYVIAGDIIDICLLDTTFYTDDNTVDFCELQIPVIPISK